MLWLLKFAFHMMNRQDCKPSDMLKLLAVLYVFAFSTAIASDDSFVTKDLSFEPALFATDELPTETTQSFVQQETEEITELPLTTITTSTDDEVTTEEDIFTFDPEDEGLRIVSFGSCH